MLVQLLSFAVVIASQPRELSCADSVSCSNPQPAAVVVGKGASISPKGMKCGAIAPKFSRAGYWDAEGSPRRVETLTTGWEFSLDNFRTHKKVALPHSIDEGEIGFEASGGVNRQQPAWYRRSFMWKRNGARQFLHFEAIR